MNDTSGLMYVAQRRLVALGEAISNRDAWENIEWHFDNAKSAIERALDVNRGRITDSVRRGDSIT